MINRDFTLEKYRALCEALMEGNFKAVTINEYLLESEKVETKIAILRHDVDRCPKNAKDMAELEHRLGIRSTYYFRSIQKVLKPEIIRTVASLGHEVGYHYESLSRQKGDYEKAIRSFAADLSRFREWVDVKTICMHGNPLSRWDNRTLWDRYDYKDFGLRGEAYLSMDYSSLLYFTDTGRAWNAGKFNIRDRVSSSHRHEVKTTDELIERIKNGDIMKICIQSHPERWNQTVLKWTYSFFQDAFFNFIKSILSLRQHNYPFYSK
jgi:hypothetical protein